MFAGTIISLNLDLYDGTGSTSPTALDEASGTLLTGVDAFGFISLHDEFGFSSATTASNPFAAGANLSGPSTGFSALLDQGAFPAPTVHTGTDAQEPVSSGAPATTSSTIVMAGSDFWINEGPAPGIGGQETVPPDNQINGAIQAIAVDPSNADIMYVGSVNGGIWKTTDATASAPHWTPLTDDLPSLSIGALEFDPTDNTHQTLIAGIGSTSSYFLNDQFTGVLRSTDGGANWSQLGTGTLAGENITSVAARGTTLLAAADNAWGGGSGDGLFRSIDSGATWTKISDGTVGRLPNSTDVSDIVGDPLSSSTFYAAVTGASGGIFKSTDTGATWTNVSSGITGISATTDKIELAVYDDGVDTAVYATVDNSGAVTGVFRSLNGAAFTALDLPTGGTQGFVHNAIASDPNDVNIVYVGLGGASSHYLTRIDASQTPGSQITNISGGSFGSPHVDFARNANRRRREPDPRHRRRFVPLADAGDECRRMERDDRQHQRL